MSYGLAGAALCVVPVAVAALIGLGTSLSGVASGFAALTGGPETPASVTDQTDPSAPSKLNRTVLALAGNSRPAGESNSAEGSTVGAEGNSTGRGPGTPTGVGGSGGSGRGPGSSTVSGSGGASGGSGGGSSGAPAIQLPGTGGNNQTLNNTVDGVNNTVNNTVGTVNNTVDTVNDTVDTVGTTAGGTVDHVNNTVGGVNNTVNGLLHP